MIRRASTLVVLFVGWFQLYGQLSTLGIASGINFPFLGGDAGEISPNTSYHIGLTGRSLICNKVDIGWGILLSGQGSILTNNTASKSDDRKIRSFYFIAPIVAEFRISRFLAMKLGPQFGLLVNAEEKAKDRTLNVTALNRPIDIGISTGANIYITEILQLNANFNFGLTNTLAGAANKLYYPNRVVQVGLSYFFITKKRNSDEGK